MEPILKVEHLETTFDTDTGPIKVIEDINFEIEAGKTLGLVGESGCGKSITSLSIVDLLPKPMGNITKGDIFFKGQNLRTIPHEEMYGIRGKHISFIFQEPMTALNPIHTIEQQLCEIYKIHFPKMTKKEQRENAIQMLTDVGVPDPATRLKNYPHHLSGGLRQRIVIAMAMACQPDLLIADEPTTALDVTIQAQILMLLKKLQIKNQMSMLFISHDLGVMAQVCDHIAIMYAGKMVEYGTVEKIFQSPSHPYTRGLLSSIPKIDHPTGTKLSTIEGQVPDIHNYPNGCRFVNRCEFATKECDSFDMKLQPINNEQNVACLHPIKDS